MKADVRKIFETQRNGGSGGSHCQQCQKCQNRRKL